MLNVKAGTWNGELTNLILFNNVLSGLYVP